MSKHIAHVVVGLPVEGPFDYDIPQELTGKVLPGMRVWVMFAGRKRVGFVVSVGARAHVPKINPILKVLDNAPIFSEHDLHFAKDFSLHFACSLGEALELSLPMALRKSKLFEDASAVNPLREHKPKHQLILDPGVTQRWDILLPRVTQTLAQGQGVLVLVPDGSYLDEVLPRLSPLVATGSRMVFRQGTEKEELERWLKVRSGQARVVVGYISAVLAPVQDLGLIVIFDEESHSYKHDQSPFYHAREAAFLRSHRVHCDVICVSRAPSVELWRQVAEHHVELIRFKEAQPPVKVLDLTNFKMRRENSISQGLANHMEKVLAVKKKVMLYVPAARGTGDVVREAAQRFPLARVAGYEKVSVGGVPEGDILVVTLSVLRHRVTFKADLTAILEMDWEFHKHDHRAAHGAFALIQHLRLMTRELMVLQTRNVQNEILHLIASDDVDGFYAKELHNRRDSGLPPYAILVAIVVRSADPELASAEAERLHGLLSAARLEDIGVLEPQADRSALVRGKFRFCVMVHGLEIKEVIGFVKLTLKGFRGKKDTQITVNVDP